MVSTVTTITKLNQYTFFQHTVSVFNVPLDVTHLLRCGDVHMNPGPSSDQHSDDLQHTGIPHNLRRTHNGDHLRIVYTTAYLRFLRKHSSQTVNNHVKLCLLLLGIYYHRRARGRRAGQKVQQRASTCRALAAFRTQGSHVAYQPGHTGCRAHAGSALTPMVCLRLIS